MFIYLWSWISLFLCKHKIKIVICKPKFIIMNRTWAPCELCRHLELSLGFLAVSFPSSSPRPAPPSPLPPPSGLCQPLVPWRTRLSPCLYSNTINWKQNPRPRAGCCLQFPSSDAFLLVLDSALQTPRAHFLGMEQIRVFFPPLSRILLTVWVVPTQWCKIWLEAADEPQPSGKCAHQIACPSWLLKKNIYSLWVTTASPLFSWMLDVGLLFPL